MHGAEGDPVEELAPLADIATVRTGAAVRELAEGRIVVSSDGHDALVVVAGSTATTTALAGMIRMGSGLVFTAVSRERLNTLMIPRMTAESRTRTGRCRVPVDAARGVGTGISAADRAFTIRLLADPGAGTADFVRPGHVIPVAGDLSTHSTPGAAEIALALATMTGAAVPVAAYCALTSRTDPRQIASSEEGALIAERAGLAFVERDEVLGAFYRGTAGVGSTSRQST